ncbi:PH domain-containing protein [Bacillus sp. 1P06AnD]|uniref:PH domain-containing protein n=1 Tax=Bacillus sp. 1P06AnD TaxID=3132208 RepID=UPI0039A1CBBE
MSKQRDNIIEFLYHTFDSIKTQVWPLLGLVIAFIGAKNHYAIYIKAAFYMFIVLLVIYSFLKWINKTFEFKDSFIRISEGVFSKKVNEIPYKRVKSITTTDSLPKRLFSISNFSLELIGGSSVTFVLANKHIKRVKEQIFPDFLLQMVKVKNSTKLTPFGYLLLSTSSLKVLLMAFPAALTTFSFILGFLSKHYDEKQATGKELIKEFADINLLNPEILTAILICVAAVLVLTYIISFGYIFVTYSNFSIRGTGKEVIVEQGRFNRKAFHIPRKHMRTLRIVEPIFYRWFGYVQLEIDCVGFYDSGSTSILIAPVIKKNEVSSVLNRYFPEFKEQILDITPNQNAFFFYYNNWITRLGVVCLIITAYFDYFLIGLAAFIVLITPNAYLQWKYAGLTFNDRYITIRQTHILTVETVITFKKYVQSVNTAQSFLMKRRQLKDYGFSVYSEDVFEEFYIDNLCEKQAVDFLKYLESPSSKVN